MLKTFTNLPFLTFISGPMRNHCTDPSAFAKSVRIQPEDVGMNSFLS